MITIFNRRQLAVTYDAERPRDGSFCRRPEMVTAYFVYVRKADFTPAVKALQTKTKA